MWLPSFKLVIHSQDEFPFIISNTLSPNKHFPPTTSSLPRFNLFTILKIQFLSPLLLVLANCSVWASLSARYTAALAALLAFRYSSLKPPLFYCFQTFRFSLTVLSTVSFLHKVSLCRWQLPQVYPHISSAASRSPLLIDFQPFSTCAGRVWHFMVTLWSNSSHITASFNFQVFLLGGMRMVLQVLLIPSNLKQVAYAA